MIVVFDTNIIVEAIFWPRSTARRALTALTRRRFTTAVNAGILEEYSAITAEVRAKLFPSAQSSDALAWIASESVRAEPMPLSGELSRNPDDNLFAATAAAGKAAFLGSQDRDLQVLEKPSSVAIVTPVELLKQLR